MLETTAIWCRKVCRKWKVLASDNNLWCNLFKERWGLKIIREGIDYNLVHQGEVQRYLGSISQRGGDNCTSNSEEEESREGILNRILFFIRDLEVASTDAKRCRML
ncbi:hypothetical protein Patl1_05244 [Pistacia atlantica]|uniref:Uncharacterized protein n=1 Tax=Pistacia atlantica TaxID=434234 RepID=A0ACC1BSU1_9ROSI|nr:hypothetical protein Patl1_05244 [Pistacia atlantica]